ncbi:hypothetical protein BH10PSE6_BH10PSE6_20880 [soil metagenome]
MRLTVKIRALLCAAVTALSMAGGSAQANNSPTLVAQPGVTAPASIPELARALKYDAYLIYEYVYTNIDYSPTYGLKKGALGTLLDGRGNDMDQSVLLVALLRESGYTADYAYGKIRLNATQVNAWLGVDVSVDGCPTDNFFKNFFIPFTSNFSGATCASSLNYVDISHMWVTVTGGSLGSTTYVLDPSYKTYSTVSGINLAAATGYSRSSFVTSAKSGSTTTANSIQNVNQANMASNLSGYANSLVTWIRANAPTATPRDILGGHYVQPLTQPYTFSTTQALQTPSTTPTVYTSDASVRATFGTTFQIKIGGIDVTYYADQIYGHRLTVVYDASARPVLYLDGVVQGTGSGGATTLSYVVGFPFCWATTEPASPSCSAGFTNLFKAQNSLRATAGYTYAIVAGWDATGRGMVELHRRQLQAITASGGSASSEPVLGEALNVFGFSWLAQLSAAGDINDQIIGAKVIFHCAIGVVGQVGGPYIDLAGVFVSLTSLSNDLNRIDTVFFSTGGAASAFEWGNLDQYMGKAGVGAVSTIKLFDIANTQHDVIYDATSANWGAIQSQLVSYTPTDRSFIQAYINAGFRVILPKHGNLTQGIWVGAGYLAMGTAGNQALLYQISANFKGGSTDYNISPANWTPFTPIISLPEQYPFLFTSLDPIDMFSGAYLYDHDDLSIGSTSFPFGLTFTRSYNSNNLYDKGPLGAGWSHNFAMNATQNSDGLKGMAQDSPIDGAAAIAAAYVIQDLMSDATKPLDKVIIASLAQKWLMDRLINNTVNVAMGTQSEQFVLLADGSFNPRLGSSNRLALEGGAYALTVKDGTTLNFDANGNIATWQNTSGATVSFAYDASTPPRLTSVSNGLGRSLGLDYNGSGQLASVTDNASPPRSVTYSYDGNGNLASATDPLDQTTTYSYVSIGEGQPPSLLSQLIYPANPTSPAATNIYDSLGRVATQINANGAVWNYYFAGYRSEEEDPYGTQNVLYYNARGLPQFNIQDYAGQGLTTSWLYDGLGRLVRTTLPEGGRTLYSYASTNAWANNIASATRAPKPGASPPASLVTSYTYHPTFNKPLTVTDPRGLVTTMSYDGATGNLLTAVSDSGTAPHFNATTTIAYNALGLPVSVRNPVTVVTELEYDSLGNRTAIVADAANLRQTTAFAYDSVGNAISMTDPRGGVTTNTWDADRQLLTTSLPGTPAAPSGLVTANTYDANGQVLQVRQLANAAVLTTASATYTLTGKTATTTDARGNVTRYAYDQLDRLVSVIDPMDRLTQFTYTALSQPYRTYNTAIQAAPLLEQAWTDDGLRASLKDANGNSTSFAYDRFDRLVTTTYPGGSTETATWDADSNMLTRTTRAGTTLRYGYDTLNRLVTKTAAATPVACSAATSGTPTVTYSYDLASRVTGVCDNGAVIAAITPPPSAIIYNTAYSYNAIGQPTGVTFDPVPTPTLPSTASATTFDFTYNGANQRVSFAGSDNAWIDYATGPASTTSYTANSLNQYTAVGAVTPSYDGNGNLTSDGTFTFGYDAENRLISASKPGTSATYAFDAQGRRKGKSVTTGATTSTLFVTDADNREVLEYDGSTGAILRWYAYGLGPNDVVSQANVGASSRVTPLPDLLGSIIALMDTSTGALTRYGYKPYGDSSSAPSQFGYTGQRIDGELSGNYYYRARHYSPSWGRFLQGDPIETDGGENFYAYVQNDPLNLTDPSGLIAWEAYVARGIRIVNAALTGKLHPVTGIPFRNGFPDFSSVAIRTVQVDRITGKSLVDNAAANAAAGLDKAPAGYLWHHVETGEAGVASMTMQLVPASIHSATAHTGTAAYARAVGGLLGDVATDPTTYLSVGIGAFLTVMAPSPAGAANESQLLQRQQLGELNTGARVKLK